MKPHVKVIGGFNGTETSIKQRDWRGVPPGNGPTIINGEGTRRCVEADSADWSLLDGFYIENGHSTNGAGLLCAGSIFGGAITQMTVARCYFLGNSSVNEVNGSQIPAGGAIHFILARANIEECAFWKNSTVQYAANVGGGMGGAVCNAFSATNYVNCLFVGNSDIFSGPNNVLSGFGGACLDGFSIGSSYRNCTLYGNSAECGPGIYCSPDFDTPHTIQVSNLIVSHDTGDTTLPRDCSMAAADVAFSDVEWWDDTGYGVESGAVTTRTNDTSCVVTATGNSLTPPAQCCLSWSFGQRDWMAVTANDGTTLTLRGGTGTPVPPLDTPVTVTPHLANRNTVFFADTSKISTVLGLSTAETIPDNIPLVIEAFRVAFPTGSGNLMGTGVDAFDGDPGGASPAIDLNNTRRKFTYNNYTYLDSNSQTQLATTITRGAIESRDIPTPPAQSTDPYKEYPYDYTPYPCYLDSHVGNTEGPCRTRDTGWGLIDCGAAVTMAKNTRFAVRNSITQKNVLSMDSEGNIFMDGDIQEEASIVRFGTGFLCHLKDGTYRLFPAAGAWAFPAADGTTYLAAVDPRWDTTDTLGNPVKWPTLYLAGKFHAEQVGWTRPNPVLTPPDDPSLLVQTNEGENPGSSITVGYFSGGDQSIGGVDYPAGSLFGAGYAFIAANPDPQAPKTEFLLENTFTAIGASLVPQDYNKGLYTSQPAWAPTSGSWTITSDGLTFGNPTSPSSGAISIPQPTPSRQYLQFDSVFNFTGIAIDSQLTFNLRKTSTPSDVSVVLTPISVTNDPRFPGQTVCEMEDFQIRTTTGYYSTHFHIKSFKDPTKRTNPDPNLQYADPLAPGIDYELHVQLALAGGTNPDIMRVWVRDHALQFSGEAGYLWIDVIDTSTLADPPTFLFDSTTTQYVGIETSGQGRFHFKSVLVNSFVTR